MRLLSLTYVMARLQIAFINETHPIFRVCGAADRTGQLT
jgi:hypothetical protein